MKTLYFDCSSGISGNMVLGALVDLIGEEEYLKQELAKLSAGGYAIEISKREKNGIFGTHVDVIVDGTDEYGHVHHLHEHGHEGHGKEAHSHEEAHFHGEEDHEEAHVHEGAHFHGEDHQEAHVHEEAHFHEEHSHEEHSHEGHHHRTLADVNQLIEESSLGEDVKELAKKIFLRVAKAESKVHHKPLEEVHFHEVGAIDSIVDIVGTAILICRIAPDRILSSVVNEGHGFIECAHGTMSVPVPATSEIFAAGNVRFRQIDIDTELVTPTGAAIIAELAEKFEFMPEMQVKKTGWGAGTKDLKIPNLLKVSLGECADQDEGFVVMDTNIDDCSPELLGYTMDRLLAAGALDVYYTPVFMKKNRPAYQLTVTCNENDMEKLQDIIFQETTTIGIRYRREKRIRLQRELVEVDTKYGSLKAKKVVHKGQTFLYPEYESLKEMAERTGSPMKELYLGVCHH